MTSRRALPVISLLIGSLLAVSPVSSLSVSGPSFRLTPQRLAQIAPLVREAADEVARRLGWHSRVA